MNTGMSAKYALAREQVKGCEQVDLQRAMIITQAQEAKVRCWYWSVVMNQKGIAARAAALHQMPS